MSSRTRTLALNCGSSSLKFGVYDGEDLLLEGEAEEIGQAASKFWSRSANKEKKETTQQIDTHSAGFGLVLQQMAESGLSDLTVVGHRVVHGGPKIREHALLNRNVRDALQEAVKFAPLHLPSALAVIDAVSNKLSKLPQVICLDTAFHKDMPDVAKTLALPAAVRGRGIERYGFHGLSLESIVEQLDIVPERMVVAHLGNGSSITALRRGGAIDTSMGLTPSGGVMMGTRSGDIDPGVLIYLLEQGVDAAKLESIVDHESGLRGISERTSDMRELSGARHSDQRCDLAIRMFCYQVKKAIAGMAGALGGLDVLIFTGGIGEHSQEVRNEITSGLSWLSNLQIRVLPAQEDLQIARISNRLALEAQP